MYLLFHYKNVIFYNKIFVNPNRAEIFSHLIHAGGGGRGPTGPPPPYLRS